MDDDALRILDLIGDHDGNLTQAAIVAGHGWDRASAGAATAELETGRYIARVDGDSARPWFLTDSGRTLYTSRREESSSRPEQ